MMITLNYLLVQIVQRQADPGDGGRAAGHGAV
jgi:hypothetical protein